MDGQQVEWSSEDEGPPLAGQRRARPVRLDRYDVERRISKAKAENVQAFKTAHEKPIVSTFTSILSSATADGATKKRQRAEDARKIAEFPDMEAEILRLRALLDAAGIQY